MDSVKNNMIRFSFLKAYCICTVEDGLERVRLDIKDDISAREVWDTNKDRLRDKG